MRFAFNVTWAAVKQTERLLSVLPNKAQSNQHYTVCQCVLKYTDDGSFLNSHVTEVVMQQIKNKPHNCSL